MNPVKPKLRALLENKGVTVTPIRYVGQGRKLFAIGFDAHNEEGKITLEPQGKGNCFVGFDTNAPEWSDRKHWSQHYYHIEEMNYQPALTVNIGRLKPDILKFFNLHTP